MHRRGVLLVFAGVVLFGAGGCGGDGDGTLTHAELRAQADRACRRAARAVQEVGAPDPSDLDAAAKASRRVVSIQRRALVTLRRLEPPTDDEARYARWIALVDQTLDQAEASVEAQAAGDLGVADQANENGRLLDARADEIASELGFSDCVGA
ncbi:MAG: hypothetical protein FJW88_04980 [Actinobacteria bacterium]|nr:hypothetical protein [Actinomycetota bacterium]